MWTPTFHRFDDRAAFLAACDAAGWPRDHLGEPDPPLTVALDIIGPLAVPGYHVNALWRDDIDPAWAASQVTPGNPARTFAVPPPPPPVEPAVPGVVAAWKAKRILSNHDLLAMVEAAVATAGGLVADAWAGATEWRRDSEFLTLLAGALSLSPGEVDELFREADAIRS